MAQVVDETQLGEVSLLETPLGVVRRWLNPLLDPVIRQVNVSLAHAPSAQCRRFEAIFASIESRTEVALLAGTWDVGMGLSL